MSALNISLGDYEKQVLQELDKRLTFMQVVQLMIKIDPELTDMQDLIDLCYDNGYSVEFCVYCVSDCYSLPRSGSVPECVGSQTPDRNATNATPRGNVVSMNHRVG